MSYDNNKYSIQTNQLNLWYADFQALIDVSVKVVDGLITSLIGPSGCGKTTLLRSFNRGNERYENVTTTGKINILGKNIHDPGCLTVRGFAKPSVWFFSVRTPCLSPFTKMSFLDCVSTQGVVR